MGESRQVLWGKETKNRKQRSSHNEKEKRANVTVNKKINEREHIWINCIKNWKSEEKKIKIKWRGEKRGKKNARNGRTKMMEIKEKK